MMNSKDITSFGQGRLRTYIIGFLSSIILTTIPFILVMNSTLARSRIIIMIVLFAIIQIIVHLGCFLHMKMTSDQSWNWVAFIYTLIILGVLVAGSTWIMYHLMCNMMIMD